MRSDSTTAKSGGVVAAAFPDAAEAGVAMLRAGGNAVDAACASAWALAVCEPGESGLGGQTTMLIRLPGGRMVVLDGHSRAPALLDRKRVGRKAQRRGMCSVVIPSTAITLGEAQKRFGRLSLQQALAPAIRLAETGYAITRLQRRLLKWVGRFFAPGSPEAELFLGPGGRLWEVGEVFRQPMLARTLGRLARVGVEDFYVGEIGASIVTDMRARGGLISAQDLRELGLPVEREAMGIEYRGRRVVSLPPPGGGVQALLALRILEPLLEAGCDEAAWRRALAGATLAAFRERERWPDHPADMTPSLAKWLVSSERAARLVEAVREGRAGPPVADSQGESGNTTHLCAADGEGGIVSLTQSIQSVFGAKVAHPTLGFAYNNYLSTCPRTPHPFRLGPSCLPQSNAAPTIVLRADGTPRLALGSAGSRRIISSVVQVISAVLDRGATVEGAIGEGRCHAVLNGSLWVERSAGPEVIGALGKGFRKVKVLGRRSYKLGAVQAIEWSEDGVGRGAADPRRDGAWVRA